MFENLKIDQSKIKGASNFIEVGQAIPNKYQFALIKDDVVYPLHHPIKCREFFNDTLAMVHKMHKPYSIYNYEFSGPIDLTKTVLVNSYSGILENNLEPLNKIESELGLKKTKVYKTDKEGIVVTVGDPLWQKNSILIMWYTAMLRILSKFKKLPTTNHEYKMPSLKHLLAVPFAAIDVPNLPIVYGNDKHTIHNNGYSSAYYSGLIPQFVAYKDKVNFLAK